jgi:hypothetical protein
MFHVFADLVGYDRILPVNCNLPLRAAALGLLDAAGRVRMLIGNLRPDPQLILVNAPHSEATLKVLSEDKLQQALSEPAAWRALTGSRILKQDRGFHLELPPYAVARLDFVGEPRMMRS